MQLDNYEKLINITPKNKEEERIPWQVELQRQPVARYLLPELNGVGTTLGAAGASAVSAGTGGF